MSARLRSSEFSRSLISVILGFVLTLFAFSYSDPLYAQMGIGYYDCEDCAGGINKIGAALIFLLLLFFFRGAFVYWVAVLIFWISLGLVLPFLAIEQLSSGPSAWNLLVFPVWWYCLYLISRAWEGLNNKK